MHLIYYNYTDKFTESFQKEFELKSFDLIEIKCIQYMYNNYKYSIKSIEKLMLYDDEQKMQIENREIMLQY